jgi:hypothetical protein
LGPLTKSRRNLLVCEAMTPKHQALVEENRDLLAENDALRTEIVKLKLKTRELCSRLDNYQRIRQEDAEYIRGLWEDNQRVHAELRFHKQR